MSTVRGTLLEIQRGDVSIFFGMEIGAQER
jgi:hypothetical protein